MKNYTVGSGDTISKIIFREYAIDTPNFTTTLLDCLIRYISILNGKDLSLYDNIASNNALDPDTIKPGDILIIPDSIAEAAADPRFKSINQNSCGALFDTADTFSPDQKNNKYLWWLGYGLLAVGAIYFLTKKKKRK
jgi:hypothetical protein